jgi:fructokinase
MPNVICIGELLIDFCAAQADVGLAGATTFVKAAGGAPANVAVGVARLGQSAGFIGAVGADPFGDFLQAVLRGEGVDTSCLARIATARTSLAFIAARSDGMKDISFYRNPGADMFLSPAHIRPDYIASASALHFGSISRIDELPRNATDKARRLARERGMLITYDPNWRPSLWSDHLAAREVILEGFDGSHVAKISMEEWPFVTGDEDFAAGAKAIMARGVQLVVRSEGADGATYATPRTTGHVDAFKINCVEPTGAGDGFMACLIVELLAHFGRGVGPASVDDTELRRIIRRAAAVGALACTKVGAIPSLPTARDVEEFFRLWIAD